MKLKTAIISKQLHSSCSSMSSEDKWVYLNTTIDKVDFAIEKGTSIISPNHRCLNGNVIEEIIENEFILKIFLKADETFYGGNFGIRNHATKEQMQTLLKPYLKSGWTSKRHSFSDKMYKREQKARTESRRLAGFVIPSWEPDLPVESYQGGLSDQLFNHPYMQRYVKSGGCNGYIGASERTFLIDRAVEKASKDANFNYNALAVFLCSSSGRHFADQLDTVEDVTKHFKGYWPKEKEWFGPEIVEARKMVLKEIEGLFAQQKDSNES